VRRRLNLFQGQLLNWEVVADEGQVFVMVFSGICPNKEEQAAFQELLSRGKAQKRRRKCGGKIRKLDEERKRREELARVPGNSEVSELKSLVSDLSQYLLGLQRRL
jgi:hypothetical protein